MNLKMVKDITVDDLSKDITLVGPDMTVITRVLLGFDFHTTSPRVVRLIVQDEGFTDYHHFYIPMNVDHLVGIAD